MASELKTISDTIKPVLSGLGYRRRETHSIESQMELHTVLLSNIQDYTSPVSLFFRYIPR